MKKDSDFYKKMQEAKARKKAALAQKRLHDEFGDFPLPPQFVIKPETELKIDEAFNKLQQKLKAENPSTADKLNEAIARVRQQAEGF
jgi:hypothetical protein